MQNQIFNHVLKATLTLALFITASVSLAQDMNPGFRMLEAGSNAEAKVFFGKILKKQPENQTALICYGRATGLSGNVAEAQEVFNKLLVMKPGSEEVLLNLAESFLWEGNGEEAAKIYTDILVKNETSFAALLGYANSMSMIKNYYAANDYINKALEVDSSNAQAKLSRKFIRLGLADYLAGQKAEYDSALMIVNKNLADNAQDQNSLMLKATIFMLSEDFAKAKDIYVNNIENEFDKYIGWSVTTHMLKDDKGALKIVEEGLEKMIEAGDTNKINKMRMQYVTALLWNSELKQAGIYLDSMMAEQPDNTDLIATKAQVLIYLSDYEGGLANYQKYLKYDSASFSGNLGSADAYHALGMDNKAYVGAFNTLNFFPGQKDVTGFIDRLNAIHAPGVEADLILSETSDKSWRRFLGSNMSVGLSPLTKVSAGYSNELFSDAMNDQITVNTVTAGLSHRFNGRLKAEGELQQASAIGDNIQLDYTNYKIAADIRVSKSQQIVLAHQKELQNFNKDLLAQNISMNHFLMKNITFWKLPKIGWYSELYHTQFSDGNSRNLLFTSFYKNLTNQPLIKSGFNYSTMSFAASKPTEYYSPESFHSFEWFAGFNINQSKHFPVTILADFAVGYQISDGSEIVAWRGQLKVEKEIGRMKAKAFVMYNSLSAVANNGFSFSQAGLSLSFKLTQKPIFYNKYVLNN